MLASADQDSNGQLLALLEWYRELGVVHAIAEVAIDWRSRGETGPGKGFRYPTRQTVPPVEASAISVGTPDYSHEPARAAAPAPMERPEQTSAVAPPATRRFPTALPEEAATSARQLAGSAATLDGLRRSLESFEGCALKATAKNLCFYRGAERARLMIIGEAPGREEDMAGKPFVGPAGKLLDRMLAAIDLTEAAVHITNIVYWRPPGNRTPTPQESLVCRPFLEQQIALVAPDIILLLGGAAAKNLLDTPEGIMKLRGTWRTFEIGGKRLPTMASLHPAYLLRTPAAKRQAWQDLLAVRIALDTSKG
jgi:uracil-DNA glycosylase